MARTRLPETPSNNPFDELSAQLREHQASLDRLRAATEGLMVLLRPLAASVATLAAQAQSSRTVQQIGALERQPAASADVEAAQLETLEAILQTLRDQPAGSGSGAGGAAPRRSGLGEYADEIAAVARNTRELISNLIDIQLARADQAIGRQRERLRELRRDGREANAEILRLEEERLNQLQQQRERFVRQQQALALIELTANAAVAIAKAAAQGGAAAPFTIAATLIALAAGLAKARAQAQAALPRAERGGTVGRGELIDARRGGWLRGPRHFAGGILIEAEGGERIVDRHTAARFAPVLDWMTQAHPLPAPVLLPTRQPTQVSAGTGWADLKTELQALRQAVESQERLSVRIDEGGLAGVVSRWTFRQQRAERRAR
jgi:hypothetical protein